MVSRTAFRPTPLGRVRLADLEDTPVVLSLINESMARNFRISSSADINYIIENCVLSICQLDINDKIVGFLAAKDYPQIPAIHPSSWEEYIWAKYKSIELNSRNTLFLHLLCWDPIYARELVDNLLRTMFMHDPYLHYICMLKSLMQYPLLVPGQSRSEGGFKRVQAMERGIPGDQLPSLHIAERSEICPRLRIRRAVEEDNDDIVPIIEQHSDQLRELYGDFYVSELISRHPESERVLLVCEDNGTNLGVYLPFQIKKEFFKSVQPSSSNQHKEVAVGVMCLNTQINYETLEENYELSPFAGLRHLKSTHPSKDVNNGNFSDLPNNVSLNNINGADCKLGRVDSTMFTLREQKSKVAWGAEDDLERDSRTASVAVAEARLPSVTCLSILDLLEDEEDEVEFDIINIDTDLLRNLHLSIENADPDSKDTTRDWTNDISNRTKKIERRRAIGSRDRGINASGLLAVVPAEPTRYYGTPNAFLLELFAMHHNYDERYGFDMLEAAYELFPGREYCIMSLPSDRASFPLLEHFTLVTPFSCRMRFISDSLYVAHINSVRGDLRVRLGEACDYTAIVDVLEHAPRKQAMLDLFEKTLASKSLDSFVLLSQNQPVGMVVVGTLEEGTSVRTKYNLEPEPRRPGTDGMVLSGVLSPLLEPHARWFMRDVLRHTKFTTLFWICRIFAKGDASPNRNLMSLGGFMQPVRPRRCLPNLSLDKDLEKITSEATLFALWHIERPLTSIPKVYVNNSIVVVGASRTGLAFLETLLMGPSSKYLTFSNVTLVSERGLPTVTESLRAADTCMPNEGRFTDRYIKSMPFYFYVDVMTAVVVHIDRQKKCIHMRGGGVKFYDELVLTCGHQFQHPDYLKDSLELVKEVEKGKLCERILMDNPKYLPDRVPPPPDLPENVMLINSLYEANTCLRKLLRMISEAKATNSRLQPDNTVVVYGDYIEAYSCIAALLEIGLAPELITFVEPFPPEDSTIMRINCFNNETVDERVQASLEAVGVRTVRRCRIAGWMQSCDRVTALRLMTRVHAFPLPCFALFYYGLKAIDINAFKAINESGLVYDGGLVVGTAFDTNDPHVYAAGTCTKYSRRLYAERFDHRYYCSEDIGEELGNLFLRKFNPFEMANPTARNYSSEMLPSYASSSVLTFRGSGPSLLSTTSRSQIASRRWQPVMKFESPIIQSATLPGPLYYMKVRKPGPDIPMEVKLSLPNQGHFLETDRHGNYFQLHLNMLHCVEGVTCLAKRQFAPEILSKLYGKHEAFFDKLLTRFQMNQITDLFKFFTQPWMGAMYQETFDDLLLSINDQEVGTVYDLIKSKFSLVDKTLSTIAAERSSCSEIHSCGFGPKDVGNLGTFRSVIDKFVARTSSQHLIRVANVTDTPSECGQSPAVRAEAADFWKTVGGERIVVAHLTRYLNRNAVTNPNYAVPKPE